MSARKKAPKLTVVEPSIDIDNYKTIPALAAYLHRVAKEHEIEQRSFKRFALIGASEDGYKRDRIIITLTKDGTVTAPKGYEATDDEAKAIKEAFVNIAFPTTIPASLVGSEDQRKKLGVNPDDWFAIRDQTRKQVLLVQQRVVPEPRKGVDSKKNYLPWTLWSDKVWRRMEPDTALLPMWKPAERRNKHRIMVHEGAKSARYVDWLVNDFEGRETLANHPWAVDLPDYEHWGWIGGAPNPHRTNWSELTKVTCAEIVIVADNDLVGQQAIKAIARALAGSQVPVTALLFDDGFPPNFDLADEFPEKFWIKGRYRGPTLADCCRPATWATRTIDPEGKGRPQIVARDAFIAQWVASIVPAVFVNRRYPNRLLDTVQFNAAMMPFSDAQNTAAVLGREVAAQVDGVAYEPGRNQGIITMEGLRLINTWKPTQITRRKGDVTLWNDFMRTLFPVAADRHHVLRWCATLVARPEIRMRYGMLLISETQGVGKGTLMERILAPLVGWHNVSVPSEKQLTDSGFNSWMVRKRLVLVHEIYAGHTKKAYDSVKSNVTDDNLDVNEKNLKPYSIHNWTQFVLSSNSLLALQMVKGDRRWFVPKVSEAKPSGGVGYWTELNAWLVSCGLEAVHDWAHDFVQEHGAVGSGDEAPTTMAKERMIETSRSEGQQMVFDLGELVAQSRTPLVVRDREVRSWLGTTRKLFESDPKLESMLTIRTVLKQAGLVEVLPGVTEGRRWVAFANQATLDIVPLPTHHTRISC
jgi:hypothetical protein